MSYCQILHSRVCIPHENIKPSLALLEKRHVLDYANQDVLDPILLFSLAVQFEHWLIRPQGPDIYAYLPQRAELLYSWVDVVAAYVENGSFIEVLDLSTIEIYRVVWEHGEVARTIYPTWETSHTKE
jgi:hypothetical protein